MAATDSPTGLRPAGCAAIAAVVVVVVFFFAMLIAGAEVPAGHVGVISTTGAIDQNQQVLQPGWHFLWPIFQGISGVSTQPQNHQFREVGAASLDLQNVYVDGGVSYHISADQAARIQIEGGADAMLLKVFDPAFQDVIKEIVPQYQTEQILASRSKIRNQVVSRLQDIAGRYGFSIDDVFITNIHFDQAYTAAIEQKAVAQQHLEQARIDAQTTVTQAQGRADANKIESASLTPNLVQQHAIDKWNGHLPAATSGTPFINLSGVSQ